MKTIDPENLSISEMREIAYIYRADARDAAPSMKFDVILGALMISTAPEFATRKDPRVGLIEADTIAHIRTLLESGNVDVEHSIDVALNRTAATA